MAEHLPLTGGDLREIADALDEVEATTLAANKLIGRIEVYRPDAEDEGPIGWITRFDPVAGDPDLGWGFVQGDGDG